MSQIEHSVLPDDWAKQRYETSGNVRWRSIFAFASVGLVKAGYVRKAKSVWTMSDEGRRSIKEPFDAGAFLDEVNRRYDLWKQESLQNSTPAFNLSKLQPIESEENLASPEERLTVIIEQTRQTLAVEIIDAVKQCDPEFFERLVVQLLLKMGYGAVYRRLAKPLVNLETVVSMASLMKTVWGWKQFTCKPSAGRVRSGRAQFVTLKAHLMPKVLRRAYLLPLALLLQLRCRRREPAALTR
jgi:hypothetical protein